MNMKSTRLVLLLRTQMIHFDLYANITSKEVNYYIQNFSCDTNIYVSSCF